MAVVIPTFSLYGNYAAAEKYYKSLPDLSVLTVVPVVRLKARQDVHDPTAPYYATVNGNIRKYFATTSVVRPTKCQICHDSFSSVILGPYTIEYLGVVKSMKEKNDLLEVEVEGYVCSPSCVKTLARFSDIYRSSSRGIRYYEELTDEFLRRLGCVDVQYSPLPILAEWNGGGFPADEYKKGYKVVESHATRLQMINVATTYEIRKST